MGFLSRIVSFVARPTQSRTTGLVTMLLLVATVSLTVYVAQQQQQIKQRAAAPPQFIDPLSNITTVSECNPYGYFDPTYHVCCPATHSYYCSTNNMCGLTQQACGYVSVCTLNGGQCIGNYPCNIGTVPSNLSCKTSGVCCLNPTSTPTPTPTCGSLGQTCCVANPSEECNLGLFCGSNNICQSSTGGATPTPTPTPTPTCGAINQTCCSIQPNCKIGLNLFCNANNICQSSTGGVTPTSGPTPTPDPRCGVPECTFPNICRPINESGAISYICEIVSAPTPTPTPIGLCESQICSPNQTCVTDPGDGSKSCTDKPTPIAGCSLLTVKGSLACFQQLYNEWKNNIRNGNSDIIYFNNLKNAYLGK